MHNQESKQGGAPLGHRSTEGHQDNHPNPEPNWEIDNKTAKAFGGCKKCYGKGYATVMYEEHGADDFGREGYTTNPKENIKFCSCDRGKKLKSLLKNEVL